MHDASKHTAFWDEVDIFAAAQRADELQGPLKLRTCMLNGKVRKKYGPYISLKEAKVEGATAFIQQPVTLLRRIGNGGDAWKYPPALCIIMGVYIQAECGVNIKKRVPKGKLSAENVETAYYEILFSLPPEGREAFQSGLVRLMHRCMLKGMYKSLLRYLKSKDGAKQEGTEALAA